MRHWCVKSLKYVGTEWPSCVLVQGLDLVVLSPVPTAVLSKLNALHS